MSEKVKKLNPKISDAIEGLKMAAIGRDVDEIVECRATLLDVWRETLMEMGRAFWGGEESRRASEFLLRGPIGLGTGKPDLEIPHIADSILYPESDDE